MGEIITLSVEEYLQKLRDKWVSEPTEFSKKQTRKLWNKIFGTKMERIAVMLANLETCEERIYWLKLLHTGNRDFQHNLNTCNIPYFTEFAQQIWSRLDTPGFLELRSLNNRRIGWLQRLGIPKIIYDGM